MSAGPRGPQEYERLLAEQRELRELMSECDSALGAMTCSRDEYRAACNAVARERDDAIHELALAEDGLRVLRAPAPSAASGVRVDRAWAMPSSAPFTIAPIRALLEEYRVGGGWADPFAGDHSPAGWTNDIRPETAASVHLDALAFLEGMPAELARGVLLDPPYSLRQRHECYDGVQQIALTPVLDQAARVVCLGGLAICCGWNSNGLGKRRGFALERVLLVAHGAQHNDTIVTVERKVNP